MAFRKRSSPVLEKADRRISSLQSIDPSLDLGNGLTLQTYAAAIETMRQKLAAYNTMLSNVTQIYDDMLATEQTLADLNMRMLTGVLTKYGRNSIEYEMAGGKRRQKRSPKSATIATESNRFVAVATSPVNGAQNGRASNSPMSSGS